MPERSEMRLSDAYTGKGEAELVVTVLNINVGNDERIMASCEALESYAVFVNGVRTGCDSGSMLSRAVDDAVAKAVAEDRVLAGYFKKHRAEVKDMLLTEFDEEKFKRSLREEGRAEGREEGRKEGREEGREEGQVMERDRIAERLRALGYDEDAISSAVAVEPIRAER